MYLVYLRRELRRRPRRALLIALGLGVGVGLVMTTATASAGVSDAQATALRSLYGIGTGLTVTDSPGGASGASGATSGGGIQDPGALLPTLRPFPASAAGSIARLPHVSAVAGDLQLTELTHAAGGLFATVTVDGVTADGLTADGPGPLAGGNIGPGRGFTGADAGSNVAVLDAGYATANRLGPGSAVTVAGARFTVIGLVRQAQGADIYLPLGAAQRLARSAAGQRLGRQVNVVYVTADSAAEVTAVLREITWLLPGYTVTSAGDLASAVTGSLASAATLLRDLGRWVAAAALIAAVAVAALLMVAAVTRRVRDFGTLRALGWTTRRIVGQIAGESAVIGLAGAVIGLAAGFAGAALVTSLAPALSASVPGRPAAVTVRVIAHASLGVAVSTPAFAIGGGLLAGALGAWRAARLQPADAFARIT